jgi:hypothetical protein
LSQDITQAWVASTTLFGDIWRKTTKPFDISKETSDMAIDEDESNKTKDKHKDPDVTMKEAKGKTNQEEKEEN